MTKINFKTNINISAKKLQRASKSMRGFSLVELLISITLFTFVALVSVASLVSTQQLNSRLKATRTLYDNMYYSMDEMARELRQGNTFENGLGSSSAINSSSIKFRPYQEAGASNFYTEEYYLDTNTNTISKRNNKTNLNSPDPQAVSAFVSEGAMTNENIKITNLKFEIVGGGKIFADTSAGEIKDYQQPGVKIIISGETKEAPIIKFQLENFVTQRDTDQ